MIRFLLALTLTAATLAAVLLPSDATDYPEGDIND